MQYTRLAETRLSILRKIETKKYNVLKIKDAAQNMIRVQTVHIASHQPLMTMAFSPAVLALPDLSM